MKSSFTREAENITRIHTEAVFGAGAVNANMPTVEISASGVGTIQILDALLEAKVIPSKGEGRRLITQGGMYLNDVRVEMVDYVLKKEDFSEDGAVIRLGKKKYYRMIIK